MYIEKCYSVYISKVFQLLKQIQVSQVLTHLMGTGVERVIIRKSLQYEIFWCYDQDCLIFSGENPAVLNRHRNEVDTAIAQDSRLRSKLVIKMLAVIVVPRATAPGFMDDSSITTEATINCRAFFLELCWFSKKSLMLYLIVYWKLLRVCLM